jgi:hypothetical protein
LRRCLVSARVRRPHFPGPRRIPRAQLSPM